MSRSDLERYVQSVMQLPGQEQREQRIQQIPSHLRERVRMEVQFRLQKEGRA